VRPTTILWCGIGSARGQTWTCPQTSRRPREARSALPGSRARRDGAPSGEPPPLPHHLQTSGFGWLIAAVVLAVASVVVFVDGWRGPGLAVTAVDTAVVGWLAGLRGPD
jgi:hypothetical protein